MVGEEIVRGATSRVTSKDAEIPVEQSVGRRGRYDKTQRIRWGSGTQCGREAKATAIVTSDRIAVQ